MVTSQCLKTQNYVKLLQSLVFPFRSQPYFSKSTQIFWVSHFWCHDTHLPQPNVYVTTDGWEVLQAASHEKLAAGMESDSPVRVEPHTRGSHRKQLKQGGNFPPDLQHAFVHAHSQKWAILSQQVGGFSHKKTLKFESKPKNRLESWFIRFTTKHFFLNIQCEVFHNWKMDSFTNWPSPL